MDAHRIYTKCPSVIEHPMTNATNANEASSLNELFAMIIATVNDATGMNSVRTTNAIIA